MARKRKASSRVRRDRDIRRMVKEAGGLPAFVCLVEQVMSQPAPRRGGRKKNAVTYDDARMWRNLALFCEVAKREKGMEQFTAIKWLVEFALQEAERLRKPGEPPFLYFGTYATRADGSVDADSIARRLDGKLKQGKIPRGEIPAGIDPSKFTFKPL